VFLTEPGTYQLVVSRGPRYSAFTQNVTLTAGSTLNVNAQIAKVVPTPGFIMADFHVHGILSPDSEVTQVERIATQLAEGNDFFTPVRARDPRRLLALRERDGRPEPASPRRSAPRSRRSTTATSTAGRSPSIRRR
jgi:hypothetical protein